MFSGLAPMMSQILSSSPSRIVSPQPVSHATLFVRVLLSPPGVLVPWLATVSLTRARPSCPEAVSIRCSISTSAEHAATQRAGHAKRDSRKSAQRHWAESSARRRTVQDVVEVVGDRRGLAQHHSARRDLR